MQAQQIVNGWLQNLPEPWPSFTALADLVKRIDEMPAQPTSLRGWEPAPTMVKRPAANVSKKRHVTTTLTKQNRAAFPADTPALLEAKRKPLEPAIAAAARGERVEPELAKLADKPIALPERETRTYTTRALRKWMSKAMGAKPPEAKPSANGKRHSNPQPLAITQLGDEISKHRRMDCPELKRCIIIAKRKQWKSFGCGECAGPGK